MGLKYYLAVPQCRNINLNRIKEAFINVDTLMLIEKREKREKRRERREREEK